MDPQWQGENMRSKRISRILRPPPRGRKAFTLIELLVVIAIIALLMALLFPALQGARKRTQAVKCQGILRQWGLYYSMYTAENNYRMPVLPSNSAPRDYLLPWVFPQQIYKDPSQYWHDLDVYRTLLLCPTASKFTEYSFFGGGGTHSPWTLDRGGKVYSSYGQNMATCVWVRPDQPTEPRWPTCLVKGAARIPVYSDAKKPFGDPQPDDPPPERDDIPASSTWDMTVYTMDRHQGGINSLFLDWSVRKVGLKELWMLKWSPDFDTAGPWTKAGGITPNQWPKWMQKFKDY
jgi:prepilin-type N-terminal cleavage/methylation domain-containing protein/prepilin-type processing-associated H-X9-DG protein